MTGPVGPAGPEPGSLHVHRAGPRCLVQDRGRPGWAHLGVPRAGALDAPAAALAHRLVGNHVGAALLEVLLGGLEATVDTDRWAALTGAPAAGRVDGRPVPHLAPFRWRAGARLRLAAPATGLRTYLAVAGGLDVEPVLGSRSTDTLAGVGPPLVTDATTLRLGAPSGPPAALDAPRLAPPGPLRVVPGPRLDWFAGPDPLARLCSAAYVVRSASDRIGLRLDGPGLARAEGRGQRSELPSEGVVLGAVQVPPDGRPVVFLADHPPTGGYPVVAVVHPDDLWRCAQVRPGEQVRFSRS